MVQQFLTGPLHPVLTYSPADLSGDDLLLQLEHEEPVVLFLVRVLENLLLPHLPVQPSVIKKVNNMMKPRAT